MGFKPLATISSLTDLQTLLRGLEFPTMQGFPILAIDDEGFTFKDGIVTLNDPPPEYALITAHMADSAIHGDHTALKNYCLKCTGTPGATAILPTPLDIWNGWLFLHLKFRFDADPTVTKILYRRHTQTDTLFEFGLEMPGWQFYLDIGTAARHYCSLAGYQVGQWHDVVIGMIPANGDTIQYIFDGKKSEEICSFTTLPSSTEDLIDVGCAGVSIAMLAVSQFGENTPNPYLANIGGYSPTPVAMPIYAKNYYNFRPVTGVTGIKDHALISTYRVNLTLATGATIETYEMI